MSARAKDAAAARILQAALEALRGTVVCTPCEEATFRRNLKRRLRASSPTDRPARRVA